MSAILAKLLAAKGLKTYVTAAGLLGLGVFQLTSGDLINGSASVLAALTALGLNVKQGQTEAKVA
jgi:hypothetical protein